MTDIPEAQVVPARRSLLDRVSVVWLVPLAALATALGVAWETYSDQGPLITVLFEDAAGINANETELRYRDVPVGIVESVSFTDGLDRVGVQIRVHPDVAPYVDESARFWVVSPEVTAQGVSGLDTVLSGVYVQGDWDREPGEPAFTFDGEPEVPLVAGADGALLMTLTTTSDTLSGNTPLLYKGVEVGQVGSARVSLDGFTVEADAIVFAPYDALVTEQTRFWDTSGFSLSIGTSGASVDFESVASLIAGGVTFDTFVSGAPLAEDGATFEVFASADTARSSVFARSDGPALTLTAIFDDTVAGLSAGAPVELDGLRIGTVEALNGVVERDETGAETVRLQTLLTIRPQRLGFDGLDASQDALNYLAAQVTAGLRARLATGNILTGGLKVQLVSSAEDGVAEMDIDVLPYPELPTAPSEITDVAATAEDALARIEALPIEDLLDSARVFLESTAILVASEETQAIPGDVRAILDDVRTFIGSPGVQQVPERVADLLVELDASAEALNGLLADLDEAGAVERVLSVVDGAGVTLERVNAALAGVPDLIAEVRDLADRAAALAFEELAAGLDSIVASAERILTDEALAAVPEQIGSVLTLLGQTLEETEAVVQRVGEGEPVARALAAIDAAANAAVAVEEAVAGVPELVASIDAAAQSVAAADVAALGAELERLAVRASALLAEPAVAALPADISGVLAQAETILSDIAEADVASDLAGLIAAAEDAAVSAGSALDGVPGVVSEAEAVLADLAAIELQALAVQLESAIGAVETLIAQPTTQDLPGEIGRTLSEVSETLQAFREGGAVDNTNALLISARDAAESLSGAVAGLPALIQRADTVLATADGTISDYSETGALARDLRAALREVAEAADTVGQLARTLERRPNSLILGR